MLARVLAIEVEEGRVEQNPCRNLRKLMKKVERQQSDEVRRVDSWSREEVATLLSVARSEEPAFHPLLVFLLSTGARKGEALALKWADVDFGRSRIEIRRALVRGLMGPPKSGKARSVVLSAGLAETLTDLALLRRRQVMERGWGEVPELVFCSEKGGPLDERNVVGPGSGSAGRPRPKVCGRSACTTRGTHTHRWHSPQGRACVGSPASSATRPRS